MDKLLLLVSRERDKYIHILALSHLRLKTAERRLSEVCLEEIARRDKFLFLCFSGFELYFYDVDEVLLYRHLLRHCITCFFYFLICI